MAKVDLATPEEMRLKIVELGETISQLETDKAALVVQAGEHTGEIERLNGELSKAQEINQKLFLRIPVKDNTEETTPEEDEPQTMTDFAHSISKDF